MIEYGKLYPRATPQYKIEKMLQRFNTKAGLKFLDQIISALQNVMVENPWAEKGNVKVRKPSSPTMHR